MKLHVNGEELEVEHEIKLSTLLQELGQDPTGSPVAVAVNLRVIAREDVAKTHLQEGDRVDVVTAVGGG